MRFVCFAFLALTTQLIACSSGEAKDDEPGDYTCLLCDNYEALGSLVHGQGEEAGCNDLGIISGTTATCDVDGERFETQLLTFGDCARKPACVDDSPKKTKKWDYECHVCGDIGEIDRAVDGGLEDSSCENYATLPDQGSECPSGENATLVGFNECGTPPLCP